MSRARLLHLGCQEDVDLAVREIWKRFLGGEALLGDSSRNERGEAFCEATLVTIAEGYSTLFGTDVQRVRASRRNHLLD